LFYAGFDVTVDASAAPGSVMFAHFLQGTTNFTSRLWVTAPTASGYRLALSNDSSITDADGEVFSSDLTLGTSYRVVVSYDFSAGAGTLWINPVDQSSPSLSATDPGFNNAVAAYAFRQGTLSSGGSTQTIDNLYVATTFTEALTGIPEPATAGFLLLGSLFLARRRR
jgi:hypothetical protein